MVKHISIAILHIYDFRLIFNSTIYLYRNRFSEIKRLEICTGLAVNDLELDFSAVGFGSWCSRIPQTRSNLIVQLDPPYMTSY